MPRKAILPDKLKARMLELRKQGLSHARIAKELRCSRALAGFTIGAPRPSRVGTGSGISRGRKIATSGMSQEQIANTLGLAITTIQSIEENALRKLRMELDQLELTFEDLVGAEPPPGYVV